MEVLPDKIIRLRQLLAGHASSLDGEPSCQPTGWALFDEIGLPRHALSEFVPFYRNESAATLALYGLLHAQLERGERAVLIDGKDGFSPNGLPPAELERLLWVRCRDGAEAIKAADLIIRDGNIPFIVLFLALNPISELRRIPAMTWHRLQRLAEKSAVSVLVFSAQSQVTCARLRLLGYFESDRLRMEDLQQDREDLLPRLKVRIERGRILAEEKQA